MSALQHLVKQKVSEYLNDNIKGLNENKWYTKRKYKGKGHLKKMKKSIECNHLLREKLEKLKKRKWKCYNPGITILLSI